MYLVVDNDILNLESIERIAVNGKKIYLFPSCSDISRHRFTFANEKIAKQAFNVIKENLNQKIIDITDLYNLEK